MLREIPLPTSATGRVPASVDLLIREADRRTAAFFESGGAARVPKFVPSDHLAVYDVLVALRKTLRDPRSGFLEWGSGMGAATCLAALAGFHASGIELDPELVDCASSLATDQGIDVSFRSADIFKPGIESLSRAASIIFAYPWPLEVERWARRFDALATPGTLLLTFEGIDELHLYRKESG